MQQDNIIRESFKKIRESKNITQDSVDKKIYAGDKYTSHFETGQANPSLSRLIELLGAVELEIALVDKVEMKDNTSFSKVEFIDKECTPLSRKLEVDSDKISFTSFNPLRGNIKDNIIKMIKGNIISAKLIDTLLESGLLCKQKEFKEKCIKINVESDDDFDFELIECFHRLCVEKKEYDEKLNFETKYGFYSVFEMTYANLETKEIYLSFCNGILDELNLEQELKIIVDKTKIKTEKLNNYLVNHPNGVPFICGMDSEFKDEVSEILQWKLDISLNAEMNSLQIIEAWSEEEAKKIFIEKIKPYYIERFYDELFVNEFAESLYYGDIFNYIVERSTTYSSTTHIWAESLYDKYVNENKTEEICIAEIINSISKEELIERLGIDYFNYELETYLFWESFAKMRVEFE